MDSTIESIDSFKMINSLNTLRPLMADSEVKRSLRLLAIFGENGSSIIYVTADDRAFGYGNNRYGCLGLALKETTKHVSSPTPIPALSGRQLANVFAGFGHCIGLTAGGQCLSWGDNDFGQCGVGTLDATQTPQLITKLTDKHVMTAACGNRHSVALTDNGDAYGWGRNSFGQIGNNTTNYVLCPVRVAITSPIATISCGKCHSLAVTSAGVLYVWGFNEFGQLGRHRDCDQSQYKERAFSKSPITVKEFADKVVAKAVCGPNHTLALTSDGTLYAFGLNDVGQIGNGTCNTQWTPAAIPRIKFQDIVATYDSNISLGVAIDGKYYVWGLKYKSCKLHAKPHTSELQTGFNLLDVYYRYSGNYKTFKTIIFDGVNAETKSIHSSTSNKSGITSNGNQTNGTSNIVHSRSSSISSSSMISLPDKGLDMTDTPSAQSLPQTAGTPLDTTETSIINELIKHFGKAFDNQLDCDLKFVFKDKAIHCHKRLLQIRNDKFWRFCSKYLTSKPQNTDEIHVKSHSYETIYAFIQCLYGLKPKITDYKMAGEVLILSTTCDERQLKDLCAEYLMQNELNLNSAPVSMQRDETRDQTLNTSAQELVTYWKRLFNKRETSDFRFIINDRIIYCHKTLLEIRCPALWQRIYSMINENATEIPIKGHPFEEFREFIGYLYGIEPKFSPELHKIARMYGQNIEVFAGSGDHSMRSTEIVNGVSRSVQSSCLASGLTTGDGIISEAMFASTLFTPLFNNENNFDIKFVFKEKHIFAHKFILSKRNPKFWSKCEQRLGSNGVIDMTAAPFSVDSMHSFIGYLYGMAPHVNDQTVTSLLKLAKTSGETVLKDICMQFLDQYIL